MTPTRQRRKSQQEWREFRELKDENLQFKLDFKMAHGLGGARRGAGKRKAATITVPELSQHVAAQLFHDRDEPVKRLSTKERWEKLRETNDESLISRGVLYLGPSRRQTHHSSWRRSRSDRRQR